MDLDDTRLREAFVVLLERDGLPADIYVQLGNAALMQMKDKPLADLAYDRALAVSGRNPQYAIDVVTKLVSAGAVDEAQRFLARAEHQGVVDVDGLNITLEEATEPSATVQAPAQ
jgi:Tfp pilus assembly protein PilF